MIQNGQKYASKVYAVLLAGGSGTRLWPLSRGLIPKHLLSLNDNEPTFLQKTAQRLLYQITPERLFTVTYQDHLFEVKRQLHEIHPQLAQQILVEPKANNTLPAIAWAVSHIAQQSPDALIAVFPSDHLIQHSSSFYNALEQALRVAHEGYLVTLGIKPARPEVGYGYIQRVPSPLAGGGGNAFQVLSFTEKPTRDRAESYLADGNYYWNSGIFAFQTTVFLKELSQWEPDLFKAVQRISQSQNNSAIVKEEYSKMKSISIDYGIMEKAKKAAVVPTDFGWSDVGSWNAVYEQLEKDENQNVVQGDVTSFDTHSSLLISKKGLIAAIGMKDIAIIQTGDAVLVSPLHRSQEVKKIVDELKQKGRPELTETHQTVLRPWGSYTVLEESPFCKIKRIVVNPGQALSLQRHLHRAEHWVVIEGVAKVTNGEKEIILKANESTFIPQGTKHRLANSDPLPLVIIEVQTGSYVGEDDIQRFDDVYGRK